MIRDIRTLRNHPPVLRVDRRDPPLFGECLKIRASNNVNLAGKNIQFREELWRLRYSMIFERHSAERLFFVSFYFFLVHIIYVYLINFVSSHERKLDNFKSKRIYIYIYISVDNKYFSWRYKKIMYLYISELSSNFVKGLREHTFCVFLYSSFKRLQLQSFTW